VISRPRQDLLALQRELHSLIASKTSASSLPLLYCLVVPVAKLTLCAQLIYGDHYTEHIEQQGWTEREGTSFPTRFPGRVDAFAATRACLNDMRENKHTLEITCFIRRWRSLPSGIPYKEYRNIN